MSVVITLKQPRRFLSAYQVIYIIYDNEIIYNLNKAVDCYMKNIRKDISLNCIKK